MKTPKKKYSGKYRVGTALMVVAALVMLLGCKQEAEPAGPSIPEGFVEVKGATINGAVADSEVFIAGRTVEIGDFWMSDHEVTQGEYAKYMTPAKEYNYGKGVNHPAYYVSWYDAIKYCNKRSLAEGLEPCYTIKGSTNPDDWGAIPTDARDSDWDGVIPNWNANGYRLPTEAEWEYAARGGNGLTGTQTTYAGSTTEGDVAWYTGNSDSKTHEVKGKKANALGLCDMSGNVKEWCWDRYGSISSTTDDTGAVSGSIRVLRGGAWDNNANYCTVSYRNNFIPYDRDDANGLRVVRTVVPTQN